MFQCSLAERTVPVPDSVPGNGSGGSSFRFRFGSWENGSDGSGFRFRFGSWATLKSSLYPEGQRPFLSEPRFSTPCEMRFFLREKGKTAFVECFSLKRPFSLSWEKSHLAGGRKSGGSLISVPLALRVGMSWNLFPN